MRDQEIRAALDRHWAASDANDFEAEHRIRRNRRFALLGLHTVLGLLLAFLLNLNRVAVLLGVYTNLPWILGEYYAFTTMFGATITGTGLPQGFRERLGELFALSLTHSEFWYQLALLLRPLLWPYIVGSFVGAGVCGAIAYPLALAFVSRRRRRTSLTATGESPVA